MVEYDAFGRKTGEDPLDELRESTAPEPGSAPPSPPPRPGAAPPRIGAPPARAGAPPSAAAGAPAQRLPAFVIGVLAIVAVGAVGTAVSLFSAGDTESGVVAPVATPEPVSPSGPEERPAGTPADPQAPAGQPPPATKPATTPAGLQPGSLLRQDELMRALKELRGRHLGQPVSFRLAADRIDLQTKTRGRLRTVRYRDGRVRELSLSLGGFGHVPAMSWEDIQVGAPERLVRAAAERARRRATDVDYLVLMSLPRPTWGLFFKGGAHFQGDAAGRITRRID